jgi:hypothetical protein
VEAENSALPLPMAVMSAVVVKEFAEPGAMSATSVVPAVVPSVTHSS